jgi:hypothetical protein
MSIFFTILAVLLAIIIIWQAKISLPRVASVFPGVKRHLNVEADLPKSTDDDKKSAIREVTEKLKTLGFSYLGVLAEKAPLWGGSSRELVMVSQTAKVFVYLGMRLGRPAYFFYTPFTGGEVVITAHNTFRNAHNERLVMTTIPSGEPAEMLALHRQQVEKFAEMGRTPFTEYSRESLIKGTLQYYESSAAKRQLRLAGAFNVLYLLICLFLLAILIKGATG